MTTRAKTATHRDQLQRLRAENEALRQQLRASQRLAAVGTMTAMVAHEFNNILTPIINYAALAKRNPALTDKAIDKAADGGKRASDICKAILGVARPDAQPQELSILELVSQTLSAMAREPQKDGVELVLDIPQGLTIKALRSELQQVLLNLLINARAAVLGRSGLRRIEIRACRNDEQVTLSVSDNGGGIEPENLQKIFEPFFTTKGEAGHGLGLTICRDIIESMNGRIEVQSTAGEGSTFTLHLPA